MGGSRGSLFQRSELGTAKHGSAKERPHGGSGLKFEFDFDSLGNQTVFRDPLYAGGPYHERLKEYDSRGRLSREFGPVGDANSGALNGKRWVKQYSYNDAGQLASLGEGTANADRTGLQIARTVSYTHDPWTGAQTEARYSNDGRRVVRHYLDNGLLDRVEVFQGSVTAPVYFKQFSHDPATWRVAGVTSPEGWIAYEHNDFGQVSRVRTSVGQDVDYLYNQAGQLSLVRRHTSGGREMWAESRPQATVWAYMSARLSAERS